MNTLNKVETRTTSGGFPVLRGDERRKSQRVMIRMPVTLEFASEGKRITLDAMTESVNDHGALLLCTRLVASDTNLEIRRENTQQKQLCRVTRAPIESAEGYLVPVEFSAAAPSFWGISFPPANWKVPED